MTDEIKRYTRRSFLKTGAFAGVSVAALGALSACGAESAADEADENSQKASTESTPEVSPEVEATGDTIYIIDILHCHPGDGEALFNHYMETYVPGAESRGMTLIHSNVNPPIWLTDDVASNTLEFTWSIPGMMGWAGMVGSSRFDPELASALIEFWYAIDDRVISRTRTLSAPDTDIESLTTLANL